jgi:pyruvate/2-oxoglutarate dehydrogenase complex dihydrolipoamide dehydrogenase (E3) component
LRKKGVLLFPAIKEERVEGKRFYFRERDGRQKELEFDTIVLAAGKIPSQAPWEEVRSLVQEIFFVGDITGSHGILEAISAGNEAGMRV